MSGLVVFGEDWGAHPSSTQHLVGRLAHERDVIWVNSIGLRRPRLDMRDVKRAFNKLGRALRPRGPRTVATNPPPARMSLLDPRAISWPGSRAAAMVNRVSVGRQLRTALQERGIVKPILWASLPSASALLDAVETRGVVYYCGDDFGALAGVDHAQALAMERALVERADLVLAASEELADRFPKGKTALLPHGVDFEQFSRVAPRAADLPKGGPIAGFYGSIAEWIDVEMLIATANALHNWRFVIIGNAQIDVSALEKVSNIHLLGPRAHKELASYAQHWDVSLLPFRDTPQIRACNPLKLREYLAAGAPIATTDFPALDGYREHVAIAGNPADFPDAILRAAATKADATARRMRVADESWDARAVTVASLLDFYEKAFSAIAVAAMLTAASAQALEFPTGTPKIDVIPDAPISVEQGEEIVLRGAVSEGAPVTLVLRIDDGHTSSYATRVNMERELPPGPFSWRIPIAGAKTSGGALIDAKDIRRLMLFESNTQGRVTVERFAIEAGARLPKGAIGYSLGMPDAPVLAGLTRISPGDSHIKAAHPTALRRPGLDPVVSNGVIGLEQFVLDLPPGRVTLSLWLEDIGDWENLPRLLRRRIRINGVDVIDEYRKPKQWIRERYLAGRMRGNSSPE